MGAKGAVEILYRSELGDDEKIASRTADYEDRFANPFIAAERGFIDDVIVPSNSRFRLIQAFEKLQKKQLNNPKKKFGNIPL
jgi:propionyl-CoA carboxylase beta chain